MVKSISFEQREILESILRLHVGADRVDADVTYGSGAMWKGLQQPTRKFDIDPQKDGVEKADSTDLPLKAGEVGSVMFDPPFLTYVRQSRSGNGAMAMARRYSGFWRYDELEEYYIHTISECSRVIRKGGILIVKCQDIVHNHRLEDTHTMVIQYAELEGFRLADLFVLGARNRMPSPNRKGAQKHARIHHCYFLVFVRK